METCTSSNFWSSRSSWLSSSASSNLLRFQRFSCFLSCSRSSRETAQEQANACDALIRKYTTLFRSVQVDAERLEGLVTTRELPEVLTWHAIDQALPLLGQTNSVKIGFIRSCLFELGDLLAERSEIQDRSSHLHENTLRRSLQRCPAIFLTHVSGFQRWLLKGMLNPTLQISQKTEPLTIAPRTMVDRVNSVVRFLSFCVDHDIVSLPQVGPSVIATYQQTMLWQLECKECHNRFPIESLSPRKKIS